MNTDREPPAGGRVVEEERIPLIEEQVTVGKRQAVRTISVTTRPVSEEVAVREPVMRETVTVERVPVGAVVDRVPEVREDGELTVVPVVEERVRIVTELVLVEEIHLRRTRRQELHEETVTRTRTEVEIGERDAAD